MPFDEVYNAAAVDELVKTLTAYLELSSIDGRAERQPLREKLKLFVANIPDEPTRASAGSTQSK